MTHDTDDRKDIIDSELNFLYQIVRNKGVAFEIIMEGVPNSGGAVERITIIGGKGIVILKL